MNNSEKKCVSRAISIGVQYDYSNEHCIVIDHGFASIVLCMSATMESAVGESLEGNGRNNHEVRKLLYFFY